MVLCLWLLLVKRCMWKIKSINVILMLLILWWRIFGLILLLIGIMLLIGYKLNGVSEVLVLVCWKKCNNLKIG